MRASPRSSLLLQDGLPKVTTIHTSTPLIPSPLSVQEHGGCSAPSAWRSRGTNLLTLHHRMRSEPTARSRASLHLDKKDF
ncbi:hypothetical protein EYF80_059168 [Liparis tanakae]|uniref:Uncharacterized protein n=1 Tax=Liparis tanakae TaxID=230148 RepID=A0A4Z2EP10_9TELE|nr:hypothetical protein EYF80_059168 [Liparis tanakae]